MKLAKFIAASLGMAVVSYLMFGFITWQWNPGEWEEGTRGVTTTCWFFGSLFCVRFFTEQ